MNTSRTASGLSGRTRRRAALIAALTLPLSLLSAPAIAQDPTPSPTATTPPPSAPTTPTGKALAEAKKDNRRVEIESLRSESATYYANPDGKTVRMEMHTQPIRVKDADGKGFTSIDTTLVEADGSIKPRAAKGNLVLSAGRNKTLLKSRTADATAEIATPSALPEPKLNGNTATYPDAYGKGRDLVVSANPTGFRQQITIAERPTGPVSFRVPVDLPSGLSFKKNAAGRPLIVSKDGKTLTEVRPTLLQDATASDASAPIDAGKIGKAAVTLGEDSKTLVFTPDTAFLADPAVTYPVTMTAAADDWWETDTSESNGMDTFINDVDYQDSWAGFTLDRILAGKSYESSVAKRWRSYLKFPDVPNEFAGSTVENADLILWNHLSNDCGEHVGSGITARQITSDWDETSLHWNDQPSVTNAGADTEYGAYSPNCSGSMAYEWDLIHSVDDIVQAWVDGETNYGIRLTAGNESDLRNWRRYRTYEAGGCTTEPREECKGTLHPPILTVDFEVVPEDLEVFYYSYTGPKETIIPTYDEARARQEWTYQGAPDTPFMGEQAARDQMEETVIPDLIAPEKNVLAPEDEQALEPTPTDTTAPTVTGILPAVDTTGVVVSTQIKVGFSEGVWEPVIVIKDSSDNDVSGTVTLSADRQELIFTPSQPLAAATRYTVNVSNAYDQAGNEMSPFHWSFSTAVEVTGHWTLDEGVGSVAADTSGHGHNATLSSTARWIPGAKGNALSNREPANPASARRADGAGLTTRGQAIQDAVRRGQQVEVASETTASSITYAQPDGKTFKTEVTTGPVRTKLGGKWIPIDTTLTEQSGVLKPKALALGTAVEIANGGTGAFVKMTVAGRQSYALSWPTPLPKPTFDKGSVTFSNAAGKGADLVVTVLPTGFRHDVVLRERPSAPLEIRIGVDTGGLTLSEGKEGRLLLTGKSKKIVASAPQPVMWDASAKGRLPMARHAKIATDVVTKDGRTELVLKPDHAFLTDPATTYPVRVDPTTTLPFNDDVELYSEMDAGQTADPTLPYMLAGRLGSGLFRVHLRFDTTALAGTTVTDAKLSLLNIDAPTCGPQVGAGIQVRRLTSAWDENNLHWANKPTSTTEDAQINRTACEPTPMQWPVTAIAQDWANGAANHGLVLQHPNETNSNDNYRLFSSSEETDFNSPPTLTITTAGAGSTPAISDLAITPAQDVAGVTVATSLTPQLAATVTDTIGGDLIGEFEIEHDPAATGQGIGQIWAAASAAVASGSPATVTVPTGKLVDGWKVRWRARAANATALTASAWSAWQLVTVDIPDPVSEPTVRSLKIEPSKQLDGRSITTSLTPNLFAQVENPAGGTLRTEFEIEHDPAASGQGTGQIWAGALESVPAGTQGSIAVPASTLSDTWQIRWRARAVAGETTSAWSDWQLVTVDNVKPGEEPLAQTSGTVVRTDQSFSVAAWLRWSDKDGEYSVAEQRGVHQPPFRIGNTADRGLIFTFTGNDAADATSQGVLSDVEPPVDEWFHLAGVYDAAAKTTSLYLNGALVKTESIGITPWHVDAPLALGASMVGDLDDVHVYQLPLDSGDITGLYSSRAADMADLRPTIEAPATKEETPSRKEPRVSVQSSTGFPYDRISTRQCADLRESKFPPRDDSPNPTSGVNARWRVYTYCTSRHHAWGIYSGSGHRGHAGTVYITATVVINAYAGGWSASTARSDGSGTARHPRDLAVYLRIDDVDYTPGFLPGVEGGEDELVSVQIKAASSTQRQAACQLTNSKKKESDGDPSDTVANTAEDWKGLSDQEFWWTYRTSASLNDSNRDAISYCALRPYLKIHKTSIKSPLRFVGLHADTVPVWDRPKDVHSTDAQALKDAAPSVRCDSSPSYPSHQGGCIFHRVSRIYQMSQTEPANAAKPMREVAQHVARTVTHPNATYPKLDFSKPPEQIASKYFPGHWPRTPLHYTAPDALTDDGVSLRGRNGTMKNKVCKRDFVDAGWEMTGKECDEYPFATTLEGAGQRRVDSDPKTQVWNFSIWPVDEGQNGNAGNHKQTFEMQYRFLHADPFWVHVN